MQLLTSATQVDYYPVTPAGKRYVRRVTWHPGADTEMTTFSTIVKTDMVYDCLLYTSPSPRDATLARMPSSA